MEDAPIMGAFFSKKGKPMKEIGTVKKLNGNKAKVIIKRHAACGDCGACQVGKDKMTMTTLAQNPLGAVVGDTVAVEMEFGNVMKATSIAYGIPLVAFILGCVAGFFAAPALGWNQAITAFFTGILLTAAAFGLIMVLDRRGRFGKAYEPRITEILDASELEGQ